MNWLVFGLVAWVALGLELGLRPAMAIGDTPVAPSFVLPLVVFVALHASAKHARWAALLMGLLLDLTWAIPVRDAPPVVLAGPYALGMLLAAQLVLTLRGVVISKNPLTLVVVTLFAGIVLQIVVVALVTLRAIPLPWLGDVTAWRPAAELIRRLGAAAYTAGVALPLSFVLYALQPAFSFHTTGAQRRFG